MLRTKLLAQASQFRELGLHVWQLERLQVREAHEPLERVKLEKHLAQVPSLLQRRQLETRHELTTQDVWLAERRKPDLHVRHTVELGQLRQSETEHFGTQARPSLVGTKPSAQ